MSKVAIAGNASGTGTFTIAAPNSNTDRTLTLPDEAGTVLTSASSITQNAGPAFSATGSTQNITGQVHTKVVYDTEQFDTNNNFSSSRFTPNVAGYYLLTCYCSNQDSSAAYINSFIYKNGANYQQLNGTLGSSIFYGNSGSSIILYMNGSTDYVEHYVYCYPNTTNVYIQRFTGCLLRAA